MTPHMLELVGSMLAGEQGPVLEIGSYIEVNQDHLNMRSVFPSSRYVGVDVNPGPGVDRVVDFLAPGALASLVDEVQPRIVLCLYVIEHVWDIHGAAGALARAWRSNPESWLIVATHQNQPFHGTPKYGDFWRLTLPGLKSLMAEAGLPGAVVYGLDDTSNPDDIVAIRQPASRPWPWPPKGDAPSFLQRWRHHP